MGVQIPTVHTRFHKCDTIEGALHVVRAVRVRGVTEARLV